MPRLYWLSPLIHMGEQGCKCSLLWCHFYSGFKVQVHNVSSTAILPCKPRTPGRISSSTGLPARSLSSHNSSSTRICTKLPWGSSTRLPTFTNTGAPNNVCLHPRELPSMPYRNTWGQFHCSGSLLSHLLLPSWSYLLHDAHWKEM